LKLDVAGAFEEFILSTPETNRVCRTKLSKKSFNIKLACGKFFAKALNIYHARFLGVLFLWIVRDFALDLFKAFWATNVKKYTVSQGSDNVRIVELPHPAKFVNQGDFHR
jgi:hypothetical protein